MRGVVQLVTVHRSGARRAREGAYESLKGPISLAIYILFRSVLYFQLFLVYLKKLLPVC